MKKKLQFLAIYLLFLALGFLLLKINRAAPTPQNENKSSNGAHEPKMISIYDTQTSSTSVVPLEEYLYGVVAAEMPASFEPEALKAQAVAARSYCAYRLANSEYYSSLDAHHGASVCSDPAHCEAYTPLVDAKARWVDAADIYSQKIIDAVDATADIIITYNGEIVNALFHSSSPGFTESAENLWGNAVPYLVSVSSPEEIAMSEQKLSIDDFLQTLRSSGFSAELDSDPRSWVSDITLNDSGRISSLRIGEVLFTGARLRELFSLRSCDFLISFDEGRAVFTVYGNGHGVGMSQYGANALARSGMSFDEILKHYYTGVELSMLS